MKKGIVVMFMSSWMLIAMDDEVVSTRGSDDSSESCVFYDLCQTIVQDDEKKLQQAVKDFHYYGQSIENLDLSAFFPQFCSCQYCHSFNEKLLKLFLLHERRLFWEILDKYPTIGRLYFGEEFVPEHLQLFSMAYLCEQKPLPEVGYLQPFYQDLGQFLVWKMIFEFYNLTSLQDIFVIEDSLRLELQEYKNILLIDRIIAFPIPSPDSVVIKRGARSFDSFFDLFIRYFLHLGRWNYYDQPDQVEDYNEQAAIENKPFILGNDRLQYQQKALCWCDCFVHNEKSFSYLQKCADIFGHNEVMRALKRIRNLYIPCACMLRQAQNNVYTDVIVYTSKDYN